MSRLCALILVFGFCGTASADNLIFSNCFGGFWNYGATPGCFTSAYPYSLGYCGPNYGSFGYPYTPGYSWSSYSVSYYHPYRSYGYYYVSWYDQPYGWTPPYGLGGSCSDYGCPAYKDYVYSLNDNIYQTAALPPRPQVINFPAPLQPGTAQITFDVPAGAEVAIQGQAAGRVFTTQPMNGPTNYDVKVRQKNNGKVDEKTYQVTLKPGDRQQLLVMN